MSVQKVGWLALLFRNEILQALQCNVAQMAGFIIKDYVNNNTIITITIITIIIITNNQAGREETELSQGALVIYEGVPSNRSNT